MEYYYPLGLACTVQKYCSWVGMQIKIIMKEVPEAAFLSISFLRGKRATLKACIPFSEDTSSHKVFIYNIAYFLPLPSGLLFASPHMDLQLSQLLILQAPVYSIKMPLLLHVQRNILLFLLSLH